MAQARPTTLLSAEQLDRVRYGLLCPLCLSTATRAMPRFDGLNDVDSHLCRVCGYIWDENYANLP